MNSEELTSSDNINVANNYQLEQDRDPSQAGQSSSERRNIDFEKDYDKAGIFAQLILLIKKNAKVIFGRAGFLFAHLFTTVLVCAVILMINYLTQYSYANEPSMIYPINDVGNIKKCDFSDNCKSLGYVIIGKEEPWTEYVISQMASKSGLDAKTDFYKIYEGTNITQALTDVKKKNSNGTVNEYSTIVMLCTSAIEMFGVQVDCGRLRSTYTYWLLYNQSLVRQNFLDNLNAPLKMSIEALRTSRQVENAISNWILKSSKFEENPQVEHNFTYQDYPKVQSRIFSDFDTSSAQGTFWFFIPVMIAFLTYNSELLKEKEKKLRQGLMLFGVNSFSYLTSWALFMVLFNVIFVLFLVGLSKICQLSVFTNTPFLIMFICFFALVIGFNSISMCMCSLVSNNKSGSKFGYGFMLYSLFIQIFFGQAEFLELMYSKDGQWLVVLFKILLYINPSFHFCNAFQSIIAIAGNHFDLASALWIKGNQYTWSDFTKSETGTFLNKTYTRPAPIMSCVHILYVAAFHYVLVFIFDNIVASNRGFSRNPLKVLFSPCFKKSGGGGAAGNIAQNGSDFVDDEEFDGDGIVLANISKSYLMKCRRKGKSSDWALRNVNLNVRQGELFGLLGPNGAGKTTMIGLLSGILDPTEGDFFSSGLDGKYQSGEIRRITNVCPQFDILWAELTIYDHINLICGIKGLKNMSVREFAVELMYSVNLSDSLDEKISSLSGGMRRRVSIALATIGNPKILIFDEPTTGLDPENRQDIWGFINQLKKKGRTILLTTHILEEADILSDRICIMNYGKVKIIGTSSELKRKVGAGFKLNIIMNSHNQGSIDKISEFVKDHAPSASLLDSSGGALLFVIPFESTEQITKLLKQYEMRQDLNELIDDLAVSNSTLEEVFIEVTKETAEEEYNNVNRDSEGEPFTSQ